MLQQILDEMYIDPELLAELSEDQKQILFIKMRQEQVRRWKLYDEELDNKEKQIGQKPDTGKKHVNFLQGRDGCDWVWVMGEHKNDLTIEQILEKEQQEKAHELAEKEAKALRQKEEAELAKRMEEERLKVIKENEEKEAELRRKQEEAELYQSLKEARLALQKLELEKEKLMQEEKRKLAAIEAEEKKAKRKSMEFSQNIQSRRSSEIYSTLQEKRKIFDKMAEEGNKIVEESWKEQEKKAKEAEEHMRETARKARREYSESLRRTFTIMQTVQGFKGGFDKNKPLLPPKKHLMVTSAPSPGNKKPRPLRPKGKDMVINWFKKEELPKGVGKEANGSMAEWFHGIINRADTEKLLEDKLPGSFLIRVSERVWGYTLSYKESSRIKHFLIDASDSGYQFFGANQIVHPSLSALVKLHKDEPITVSGQEKLLHSCGQSVDPPDFWDLFHSNVAEVTAL